MKGTFRFVFRLGLAAGVTLGAATASLAAPGAVTLRWTAPGDDAMIGRAVAYDMRYSLTPITETNFALATRVPGLPAPQPAGSIEFFTVSGLTAGKGYYFAIKTVDEAANWSPLSNLLFYSAQTTATATTPLTLWLSPAWPNPARESTRWSYALPEGGPVELEAFDLAGRHVRTISRSWKDAGQGEVAWDLRDDAGRPLPVGVYLVRANLAGQAWLKRVVITR